MSAQDGGGEQQGGANQSYGRAHALQGAPVRSSQTTGLAHKLCHNVCKRVSSTGGERAGCEKGASLQMISPSGCRGWCGRWGGGWRLCVSTSSASTLVLERDREERGGGVGRRWRGLRRRRGARTSHSSAGHPRGKCCILSSSSHSTPMAATQGGGGK